MYVQKHKMCTDSIVCSGYSSEANGARFNL